MDAVQKLAVFLSYCTKSWLEAVGNEGLYIICEFHFYVKLICDDICVEFIHSFSAFTYMVPIG